MTVPRFDDFYEDEDNMNETRKLSLLPAYGAPVFSRLSAIFNSLI